MLVQYSTATGYMESRQISLILIFQAFPFIYFRLEQLFHAQGVDLIVEAHEHSYERLWPILDGEVLQSHYINPKGSVHVITGGAGNPWGPNYMNGHPSKYCNYNDMKSSL